MSDELPGLLALSGASEWSDGAHLDAVLLGRSTGEVLVVPTGAAYERPDRVIDRAVDHFGSFGAKVVPAMVLSRTDAADEGLAELVGEARFIYLCGGSPLHLRSVLKDSAVLAALVAAWHSGATVAGSAAGALALSDPMVDPRGGALTVGLGLVRSVATLLHEPDGPDAGLSRTLALGPAELALVALSRRAALLREPDGSWSDAGEEPARVYVAKSAEGLEALAGKPIWEK